MIVFNFFFFFNDTATTEIYTLSLHDALPIYAAKRGRRRSAVSLSGRHGAHAGVMQQRDHRLVMEPLRPPQRKVDHQVDVFAATGLSLDQEPRPAHERLQDRKSVV